jgi:transcription elongation GreA/GreB family factor
MTSIRLEVTLVALNSVDLGTKVMAGGLPMTRAVYQRLEAEVERLANSLPAVAGTVLVDGNSEELSTVPVPAAWELQLGAQRLDTLRRVLAQARVVEQDGAVIVGSRVRIRDDDGSLDAYTLVAPGEANARNGSISPESPLGAALLSRRVGETAEVTAPAGTRWVTVEHIE